MLIGLCGLKGSGKDTVANYLVKNHNFVKISIAASLKNIVSNIFGWERSMLEGVTKESREFREKKDEFWSNKLGYLVTPRIMMQKLGTDLFRDKFDSNIWLFVAEKEILKYKMLNKNIIITDCRFKNEIDMIRLNNGYILEVERNKPSWFNKYKNKEINQIENIHKSELEWIRNKIDFTINNNNSLDDLELKIEETLKIIK